jgi:hypothetical protein
MLPYWKVDGKSGDLLLANLVVVVGTWVFARQHRIICDANRACFQSGKQH